MMLRAIGHENAQRNRIAFDGVLPAIHRSAVEHCDSGNVHVGPLGHARRFSEIGDLDKGGVAGYAGAPQVNDRRRPAHAAPAPTGALGLVRIRISSSAVPSWSVIEQAEPEFTGRVRNLMDAGRHKTIATLRADGSPRISGIECEFTDTDLQFGSMTDARKGADLARDPRFALHGPTFHPDVGREKDWPGEAKIAGRAIPAGPVAPGESPEQPDGEMFIADITEVVITGLNSDGTRLVIEWWTPEHGLRKVERR